MKYLLLIGLVLALLWLLRQQRLQGKAAAQHPEARSSRATPAPKQIVACARCDVHLPQADAVTGLKGHYCSEAHRVEAEGP